MPPTGVAVRKVNTLTTNLFMLKIVNTDSLSEKHSNLFSSSVMRLGEGTCHMLKWTSARRTGCVSKSKCVWVCELFSTIMAGYLFITLK